ncbi:flagellar basal body P-ring formation chaperone FlgA [Orrella sp. JC864]|uniref:flagellar basal body P-ring formation chaperone FlgA n=1 Tax=Orrella sp. JC864 TaxID=3120298 RepID=UPI0012BC136D
MKGPALLRIAQFALAALALQAVPAQAGARAQAPAGQAAQAIEALAESFLMQQLAHLPGQPEIAVEPVRARQLAGCDSLDAFLPAGVRPRPRMSVGVRCMGPENWTLYVQASVTVPGTYYVAAAPVAMGQTLAAEHLAPRSGDLLRLPPGAVTDPGMAIGHTASQRIAAGQPLRQSVLRDPRSVLRGNTVKVLARGPGFMVASEGQALDNATPGSTVMVRTPSGQIVSGVVQDAATVEIQL